VFLIPEDTGRLDYSCRGFSAEAQDIPPRGQKETGPDQRSGPAV